MLAEDLITTTLLPLKKSSTYGKAIELMEELRVMHLPVVDQNELLGIVSHDDMVGDLNLSEEINQTLYNHSKQSVFAKQHIYDVINVVAQNDLTIIPVISEDNDYIGTITIPDLLKNFSKLIAAQSSGGVVVLDIKKINYSLSEIARIIEDTDTQILSLYVNQSDDEELRVTLKVSREDISPIIKAFERYDYKISDSFSEHDDVDEKAQQNYDALLKYLSM